VRTVRLGISTCPNDTFAFHGLLSGAIDTGDLAFEIELCDVEELNQRLAAGEFDVAKASFHLALEYAHELVVLPSGSALGFGNGPLLLARAAGLELAQGELRVLCPGAHTTASLLFDLFHPGAGRVEQVVFSEVMPALEAGRADFGVCIHEGRFTWEARGLAFVEDLGATWEATTGAPLPLGGIVGRKSLGTELLQDVQRCVRASLDHGLDQRSETLATMRRYAQEQSDDVLFAHVDLYVNEFTRDLGETGRAALRELSERARATGRELGTLEILSA